MSNEQLLEIENTLLDLNLKELTEFVSNLMNKKNNSKVILVPDKNQIPSREATPEEAQAIRQFEANPQIATKEEVLELEKQLGIKLNFN